MPVTSSRSIFKFAIGKVRLLPPSSLRLLCALASPRLPVPTMKRRLSRSPSPTITVSSTPWAPRKRSRHSIPVSAKKSFETPSPKRQRQPRLIYDHDKGYETDVEFFASNKRHSIRALPRTTCAPHPSPTRPSLVRLNIKSDTELVAALNNLHVSRCVRVRISEPALDSAFRMAEMNDKSEVNDAEMVHSIWGAFEKDQVRGLENQENNRL